MKYLKALKSRPGLVFLAILLLCGLYYNYHHIAFLRPVGIHQWRSCVSAVFPVNYYYGGNFFTTQVSAMLADSGTSDVTVVEFPIIYFIISLLYRVFGVNEFWFRMFQVSVGLAGLIWLFKASYFFTRDWFYAGFVPLLIFTSPVFVFYLNGFIPDPVALSLTFGGLYYFVKYSDTRRFRTWMVSMLLFSLAALTKTSSLLPYLGLGGVALLELFQRNRTKDSSPYFRFDLKHITTFVMVMVLVFGWYLYAKLYASAHGGSISAVQIRPIWDLDGETIDATLLSMKNWYNHGDYQAKVFLLVTAVVFLITVVFRKYANSFLYRFNILVFLGAVFFTLLFFKSMRNHDYYQINNMFLFVSIYLTFLSILAKALPAVYGSKWTKLALTVAVLLLVFNCHQRMNYRYTEKDYNYRGSMQAIGMFDIEEYLDELGIERTSLVHCTPDRSVNISLYLCNRKGLTDYSRYSKLPLEERIEKMREMGIEYVILGSREPYSEVENLDEILGQKIGQTGNTEIFKILEN